MSERPRRIFSLRNGSDVESLLRGVRVLDVAAFSPVKFGTTVLADLGADVIQIEKPHSAAAAAMPLLSSTEHPRWLWHSRNKRSVGLDLKTEEGLRIFHRLVATADVMVEGFAVGVAKRLGIDYETVREHKPDIIYASVSGFGQEGPYAGTSGHEQNYQAMGGLTAASAGPGRPPALTPLPISDSVASLYAVIGVLAALEQQRSHGQGAFLDVSIQDSVLSLFGYNAQYHWQEGVQNPRDIAEFGGDPGTDVYATSDGKAIVVSAVEPWAWEKLCRALGLDSYAERHGARGWAAVDARSALADAFASRSREQWCEFNDEHDLGISPVLEYSELLRDPHVLARGMVGSVAHATLGEIRQVSTPIVIDGRAPRAEWMPQPGDHTDEVLHELGYTDDQVQSMRAARFIF